MSDNSKRKINVLIATAGLHIGGSEVVVKHLVKTLDPQKFNISIACIKGIGFIGEELKSDGYDLTLLSEAEYGQEVDYFTFRKLLKIIRQKNIDIVHTHTNDALADAAICKLIIPRLKIIHTFHFGNYLKQNFKKMWVEQVFSRLASRLIAVGEKQRQQIRQVFHFRNKRIEKVWNGVSLNNNKGNTSLRSELGVGDRILIGTIGTLIEQKGLYDLLAVAKELQNKKDNIRFIIIGDGPLRAELEKKRDELGLTEMILFTGWMMDASKVALPVFDVFFQPSLWEAMSIAILEAMSAGKPIVATRVGETDYIMQNDVNGLLTDPKDITGMALALKRLAQDSKLRDRLGNAARREVEEKFTTGHMTKTYEQIYKEESSKNWFGF